MLIVLYLLIVYWPEPTKLLQWLLPNEDWLGRWTVLLATELCLVAGTEWLLVTWRGLTSHSLGLHVDKWGDQLTWGLLGGMISRLVAMAALFPVVLGIELVTGDSLTREFAPPDHAGFGAMAAFDPARVVVALSVAAALEELFYRGLLLPRLARFFGNWAIANIACSLLFAIAHAYQGPLGVMSAFVASLVYGTLFVKPRSLVAVTLAHFVTNFIGYLG